MVTRARFFQKSAAGFSTGRMREETKKFVILFEGGNSEFKKLEGKEIVLKGHAICRNVESDPSMSKVKITLKTK